MTRTKAPKGLREAGRASWRQARAYLADHDGDQFVDAIERYCRAVDLSHQARMQWVAEGSQLLVEGPKHALDLNPLIRVWQDADLAATQFSEALCMSPATAAKLYRRRHGRPTGANSAPQRNGAPPRVRLRVLPEGLPTVRRKSVDTA